MVARYGVQLINGEVIKTWVGDQVRTDCLPAYDMAGGGDSFVGSSTQLWLLAFAA